MEVIKSMQVIYVLNTLGVTEYYLGENVESLQELWKHQQLKNSFFRKIYFQKIIPKVKNHFGEICMPINTPMGEGYHAE
jgi:hypothetical protein